MAQSGYFGWNRRFGLCLFQVNELKYLKFARDTSLEGNAKCWWIMSKWALSQWDLSRMRPSRNSTVAHFHRDLSIASSNGFIISPSIHLFRPRYLILESINSATSFRPFRKLAKDKTRLSYLQPHPRFYLFFNDRTSLTFPEDTRNNHKAHTYI